MDSFWDKVLPADYYDRVLNNGLAKNRGIQSNWHNITFLKVKSRMNLEGRHLDFACGPGTFIGSYLSLDSIGVDISKNQIDFAVNNYSSKGKFYKLDNFNFDDFQNKFDVITVIGLLEYLDEKEFDSLMIKLYGITKKGGKILFTTPNYKSFMFYLEKIANIVSTVNYTATHKTRYNYKLLHKRFNNLPFGEFEIIKFLNLGIFFSIFSLDIGKAVTSLIEKIFQNKIGYLFLVELKKND